jgi:DNA-binding SARP family transcriptional activator
MEGGPTGVRQMLFHLLGPLEIHNGAAVIRPGAGKASTVLALLLLHRNVWVPVDRLIETAWPEHAAPPSAEANLKTYVWQLRRMLPPCGDGPRIERRPGAYRLRVAPGELDLDTVETLAAHDRLSEAVGLWRGRAFEGFYGAGFDEAATTVEDRRTELVERLADQQIAHGHGSDAIATLRALTADAPLRERAWSRLILALHTNGRRGDALATYRRARDILATELGVGPGPALTEAHRLIHAPAGDPAHDDLPRDLPLAGREAALAAVRRAAAGAAPVVVVDGLVGVGKTAFAVHAAHRLAAGYPDGRFFVALGPTAPEPAVVLRRLLRAAGVPAADLPSDVRALAGLWRAHLRQRRVLLVLDDVGDSERLAPLLPAAPGCLTLVTTGRRDWHLDGAVRVALQPLDAADSAALVRAAAPRTPAPHAPAGPAAPPAMAHTAAAHIALTAAGVTTAGVTATGVGRTDAARTGAAHADVGGCLTEAAAVAVIVARCGGLPAALRDAAAALQARPHWTVARLAEELAADPCRILSDSVRRSVTAATRRLDGPSLAAWHTLADVPSDFGAPAVARILGLSPSATRTALDTLVERGLLEAPSADGYRSHVVLRLMAARPTIARRRVA